MSTITYTGRLTVITCHCGIAFAIPQDMYAHRGVAVASAFSARAEEAVAGAALGTRRCGRARLRARLDQAEAEAEHQRSRVKGYQGALAKTKKRAAAGVCPVPGCKRSFANVARHVAKQHPDYDHGHDVVEATA